MILVNKDDLPLFQGIDLATNYMLKSIFEQVVSPNFDLDNFIAIAIVLLAFLTQYLEKLCSDLKRINPRHVLHEILVADLWNLVQGHVCHDAFQLLVDDPKLLSKKFETLITAN